MDTTTNGKPPDQWTDQQRARWMEQLVGSVVDNAVGSRTELFDRLLNRRRKIDDECDYPPAGTETIGLYRELYDREPIAARVVQVLPKATWQVTPVIYETEDEDVIKPFEEDLDAVFRSLASNGGKSYHAQEQGSTFFEHMLRSDIAAGIGCGGLILFGFDDGRPLHEPVEGSTITLNVAGSGTIEAPDGWLQDGEQIALDKLRHPTTARVWTHNDEQGKPQFKELVVPVLNAQELVVVASWYQQRETMVQEVENRVVESADQLTADRFPGFGTTYPQLSQVSEAPADKPTKKKRNLLFMRELDESQFSVVRTEWNMQNPRFGQPVMYRVYLADPSQPTFAGGTLASTTAFVHWSRVVHVPSDDLLSPASRLQCVLNRVLDIRKLFAASAEGYWQSCFTALSLETNPTLGGDVAVDVDATRQMMLDFRNRLRRDIMLKGMTAKTLAPQVVDPTPFILGQIEAICILLGIPKRVFMGSERGELASSQDDSQWNDVVRGRQHLRCTPRIICPVIDRLILVGVLRPPDEENGYTVEWPDLDSVSKKDKAAIATQITQAMSSYVGGNVAALMTEKAWMIKVLEWTKEEVDEYVDEAAKQLEEDLAEQQALADEQGMIPAPPPGFQVTGEEGKEDEAQTVENIAQQLADVSEEFNLLPQEQEALYEKYQASRS